MAEQSYKNHAQIVPLYHRVLTGLLLLILIGSIVNLTKSWGDSTRFYSAYGVVKRGFPMLPGTPDPPEVLELMKRVTIIPSHQMTLFGPRITIFTKDGKKTRQLSVAEVYGVPRTRSRSECRKPGGFDTRRLSRLTRTGNSAYWNID